MATSEFDSLYGDIDGNTLIKDKRLAKLVRDIYALARRRGFHDLGLVRYGPNGAMCRYGINVDSGEVYPHGRNKGNETVEIQLELNRNRKE